MSDQESAIKNKPVRLAGIDVWRGIVMLLMFGGIINFKDLIVKYPSYEIFQWLQFHNIHVDWRGWSVHDLIQPSFSFLVGISLPFSLAGRFKKGDSVTSVLIHGFYRAVLLIFLGIFLRSLGKPHTNFTFVDTLTQIGMGYFLLVLFALTQIRYQVIAFWIIVIGYYIAFVSYPIPQNPDLVKLKVPTDWKHDETGTAAHFNLNRNLATRVDDWFLNLFPKNRPVVHNTGGYHTLNFVPTLATMILGLIAGGILFSNNLNNKLKLLSLIGFGVLMILLGYLLDWMGICPSVKKIWTSSWVLLSGGICFVLTGLFYGFFDLLNLKFLGMPFIVVGVNSIAAYVMSYMLMGTVKDALTRHLGKDLFLLAGNEWFSVLHGSASIFVIWLILFWMYRNKIFIKI